MVAVEGGEVWADDSGGDLPPLVLLHPGVGDSRIWDDILPALTHDFRVLRYDARGYGKSPAPDAAFTLVDDLITVLDHFGVARAPIVGSSQGGDAALALAVTHPARVSALVLICPAVSGYPWPDDNTELDAELRRAAHNGGADAVAEVGLRVWAAAGRTPAAVEQLRSAARAWMKLGGHLQPNPPVFDRLAEIGVPASLLVGTADRVGLIECNREIARRIPGCELIELDGVDHLPPLRVPDRVVTMISETVQRAEHPDDQRHHPNG
jgi:pimeloyl-ACP methyl ester carboxylesterase